MAHIKKRTYNKKSIEQRIDAAYQKGCLLLAKSMPAAIEKLIRLLEDENSETARKACVDLIKLELTQPRPTRTQEETKPSEPLDPELADRLLKALAQE
ncbi:MAG TPA: hypothetical protein ENN97_09625 [Phycisphaerales bacterium]|nr:hypothetical protein [Phycisphaerales bacterium]